MDPIMISLAAFLGVASLVGAIVYLLNDFSSTTAEERLAVMTGQKSLDGESLSITKEELLKESTNGLAGLFRGLASRLEKFTLLFEQADSPIKPDQFVIISIGCCALGGIGAWVARSPAPLLPVAGFCAGLMPLFWLLFRRNSRFKKFAAQMPDAMELIARALRTGHSLASGLHVVVEEMPNPISMEFGAAYESQNLGVPIDKALKDMLRRMPNMDLKFFVTAVAIQRQTGGDLSEILDKIGYIVRERFKIMGQVQALTGEGRISGVILMGLPIVMFFTVLHMNPDYVMLLFSDPLGQKMIAFAAVLQVLGAVVIKKIVNIKI